MSVPGYNHIVKYLENMLEYLPLDEKIIATYKNEKLIAFAHKRPINFDASEKNVEKELLDFYLEVRKILGIKDKCSMIRASRISKGITVNELAKKLDRTKQEVSRWENRVAPRDEIFQVIMMHLQ